MRKSFKDIVFDRALILDNAEDIEAFCNAPVRFLESSGAMEGLPEFNGIWTADRERVDSEDGMLREGVGRNLIGARAIYLVHEPAPKLDACKYWIIIIKDTTS